MRDLRTELAPLLDQEPRSSLALISALREPSPWRVRVLTAGPRGRSRCVLVREAAGLWCAYPVLANPSDGAEMARAIDRSVAVAVEGDVDIVGAIATHLRRAGPSRLSPMATLRYQEVNDLPEADDSTRMANYFDLPQLIEIFRGYELSFGGRTTGAVERALAEAVKRLWVVVATSDSDSRRLEGAFVMGGFSPKYAYWAHMSVLPEFRRNGRSWPMAIRAGNIHRGTGLGFIGITADTNPMKTPPVDMDALDLEQDHFMSVDLQMPDRLPGEREARRAVWKVSRKVQRSRPRRVGTFSRREAGLDQEL